MFFLKKIYIVLTIILSVVGYIKGQYYEFNDEVVQGITWCSKSLEEQYKCGNLSKAIERDRALFDELYLNLTCLKAFNVDECVHHINADRAQITTLDAGDLFNAGRDYSLIPIMRQLSEGGFQNYYAVAVVKSGSLPDMKNLENLRQKKICFPWVGSLAGWIIPIYTLQHEGNMEVYDCNNQIKTAAKYFNISCAVNSLIDKYNPIGDNSDKLCSLCGGKIPHGKCTPSDPYYGYAGAFRCLLEAGDVAFLRHTTVPHLIKGDEFKSLSVDRFELLCKDGTRQPISEYRQCNWGLVPTDAVVISSAKDSKTRRKFQRFFEKIAELYAHKNPLSNETSSLRPSYNDRFGPDNRNYYNTNPYFNQDRFENRDKFGRVDNSFSSTTPAYNENGTQLYEKFDLFQSNRYGKLDLMFEDLSESLQSIREEEQSYRPYLQNSLKYIDGIRRCPVGRMSLCVTSDAEMEKCIKMKTALKAQLMKPELLCYKGHSHINCMQAINSGISDIAVFDAGDVYTGGLRYNLVPFMSEVYNLGEPEYYVVAVTKEADPDTDLTYLKGKYTCHGGIDTGAGWTYPLAHLITNGWIRPYGCDSMRAAAEYFTKACVPGALSNEYNTGVPYDNMCDLCHGTSYKYCKRDASEDYYGHTGAFRCLVEGGGDVAFVKHTTVMENTGGRRREWWARDTLNDDFELLCLDGKRAELHDYPKCNLGKIKANAIVTRGGNGYNETEIKAYINLLLYAEQLYGRRDVDAFSFSLFESPAPYADLIFQDATRQLRVIEPENRRYDIYLGGDFMRARRITDCFAGANNLRSSYINYIIVAFLIFSGWYSIF